MQVDTPQGGLGVDLLILDYLLLTPYYRAPIGERARESARASAREQALAKRETEPSDAFLVILDIRTTWTLVPVPLS